MNFTEILQTNMYPIIAIVAVSVISIIISVMRMRKIKSTGKDFLAQHPDAAKVYLTVKALITTEAVTVYSVNGEAPQHFMESGKTGFYVVPGKCDVEMSYTYSRPGVIHKSVTTSTDVVTKVLETKPHGSYILGFDRKEEVFTFKEYNN